MTKRNRINRSSRQQGFTLLELLLSIGIFAGVISVGTYITSQYTRLIINEKTSSQMLTVQSAAEEFVRTNFTQLMDSGATGNIATTGNTRAMSVNDLKTNNYLAASFSSENSLKLTMSVFIRNNTKSAAGSIPSVEVITVTSPPNGTDQGRPFQWLFDAAQFGKGKLGLMANSNATGSFNLTSYRGIRGGWQVPLTNLPGYSPPVPSSTDAPAGYIGAYGVIAANDIFDTDILYRVPVSGQPELNQMETNLDMNNRAVRGVGTMTVDNLSGNTLNLTKTGGYALSTENTMTMTGDVIVKGNIAVYADNDPASNDLIAANASVGTGTASADNVSSNRLQVNDTMVADRLTANSSISRDALANNGFTLNNTAINTSNFQMGNNGTGATLTTNTLATRRMVAGSTNVTGNYSAITGGSHQVTENLAIGAGAGSATIRSLAAQEVQFSNLCYTGVGKDDIEQCP